MAKRAGVSRNKAAKAEPKAEGAAPAADGAPAARAEVTGQTRVPLSSIDADPRWNVRREYDQAEHDKLVSSIRAHGLLQPLIVKVVAGPAGGPEGEAPDAPPADARPAQRYFLVSGFRRFRALQEILGAESEAPIPATVVTGSGGELRVINFRENEDRKDLKAWEKAELCHRLATEDGWPADKIAQSLGMSKRYVQNLVRVVRELAPSLWDVMRSPEGQRIGVEHWITLAGLDLAEQFSRYDALVNKVNRADKAAAQVTEAFGEKTRAERSTKDKDNGNGKKKKPTEAEILRMDTLIATSKKGAEFKRGARAALGWVLGEGSAPVAEALCRTR